jgi:hypothetical protein
MSESVLAGGNDDGGIQLRLDDHGARPRLGSSWWRQRRSGPVSTATDSKFVIRNLIYSAFFHIRIWSVSYFNLLQFGLLTRIPPVNSAYF